MIPEPPVTGKSWEEMIPEERQLMRDYYDTTDFSELMESGEWIYPSIERGLEQAARGEIRQLPDVTSLSDEPEQLELDFGLESKFDPDERYSIVYLSFSFYRELTSYQWDQFFRAVCDTVDSGFPECLMSGSIRSGTDRELFPEEYDESKESDRTGEKEV